MLSGQYDVLIDNLWLNEIFAIVMLIIPLFLLFMDKKWIFFYYAVSIVANLPLIFSMSFNFSYEAILGIVVLIKIIKEVIKTKQIRYLSTKENLLLILLISILMFINLATAIFHFNSSEFINRLFVYLVNMFILFIYTYFFKETKTIKFIKSGILLGSFILVISMLVELIYGHFYLGVRNLRPAGLLLDPNVCAFALNIALVMSFMERRNGFFLDDLIIVALRVVIVLGIFLTVSRSGYIGTIFVFVTYLVYYSKGKNKWVGPSVIIVFVIMYFIFSKAVINFINNIYKIIDLSRIFPQGSSPITPPPGGGAGNGVLPDVDYSNSRLALIKAAVNVFSNNFIIGVGIGNVVNEISLITDLEMNAHNLYLQLLAESGIIMLAGMLIFVYYLFLFINRLEKRFKFFILILFGLIFIESLFNHNLLNLNLIFLVVAIVLGLATISSKERKAVVFSIDNFKIRKRSFN